MASVHDTVALPLSEPDTNSQLLDNEVANDVLSNGSLDGVALHEPDCSVVAIQDSGTASASGTEARPQYTTIHEAILKSNTESDVKAFLPASLETRDSNGCTPLHAAVDSKRIDIVTLLLNSEAHLKADLEARDDAGQTALHHAIYQNDVTIARLLLKNGAYIGSVTNGGAMPLWIAAQLGGDEITEELLRWEADVESLNNATSTTALFEAVKHENSTVVWILLESGADVNSRLMTIPQPVSRAFQKEKFSTHQNPNPRLRNYPLTDGHQKVKTKPVAPFAWLRGKSGASGIKSRTYRWVEQLGEASTPAPSFENIRDRPHTVSDNISGAARDVNYGRKAEEPLMSEPAMPDPPLHRENDNPRTEPQATEGKLHQSSERDQRGPSGEGNSAFVASSKAALRNQEGEMATGSGIGLSSLPFEPAENPEPITLVDCLDRTYQFPFMQVRTWHVSFLTLLPTCPGEH